MDSNYLVDDLWMHIMMQLEAYKLARLSIVSKRFRDLVNAVFQKQSYLSQSAKIWIRDCNLVFLCLDSNGKIKGEPDHLEKRIIIRKIYDVNTLKHIVYDEIQKDGFQFHVCHLRIHCGEDATSYCINMRSHVCSRWLWKGVKLEICIPSLGGRVATIRSIYANFSIYSCKECVELICPHPCLERLSDLGLYKAAVHEILIASCKVKSSVE